jgi:glyoxylase-like metal-dependent hydrolase (beta-lactamase superfamily II)
MPELVPGVHVVEISPPSFGPGGPMNLCLLVAEGEATLIDAGLPGVSAPLLAYLTEIGLPPEAIRRVIITHHHLDHVGGLPEIIALTGAEVWAHQKDASLIDGSTPRPAIPPERLEARLAQVPAEAREAAAARMKQMAAVPGVPIDLRLVGGEELNLLGGVEILHTPGHTAGHLVLYLPAVSLLIAGDLMRYQEGVIKESPPDFALDPAEALASARSVANLAFERFVGYHGGYALSGAKTLLSDSLVG